MTPPRPVGTCPYCGEDRRVERIRHEWFCECCGKSWKAQPTAGTHDSVRVLGRFTTPFYDY